MIKKIAIPLTIIILAFIFFKIMVATKDESPAVSVQEHVWRVEQAILEKQKLSPVITLYGTAETPELFNAAAPAASQVAKVLVREGEHLDQGQLMLSLDQKDFEPLLKQAQGKVDELKALIKSEQLRHEVNLKSIKNEKKLLLLSEKSLARAEQIKKQNLASISETEQAMQQVEKQRLAYNVMQFSVNEHEARMAQLEAQLIQAEAELAKNRLSLERSQIYAPFTGVVAKVNVAQGDRVNNNEKLLSFYSMEGLEIRAKLPISILSEVQQSLAKGKRLKGVASNGGQLLPIELERLSGEAQASGVDAIFSVKNGNVPFRMGSIVIVRLQRVAQDNVFIVPYSAMYGTDRLYKIENNRLQAVKVNSVGEYYSGNEVDSDSQPKLLVKSKLLKSGDRILSTHLPNAISGLKVDVVK